MQACDVLILLNIVLHSFSKPLFKPDRIFIYFSHMKKLLIISLVFATGCASSQKNSPTVAELLKFFKSDTSYTIKAMLKKGFKYTTNSKDANGDYAVFMERMEKGHDTYTEIVGHKIYYGTYMVEYSNYLYKGLPKYKEQILKAGFALKDTTVDHLKRHIYTYTKSDGDMRDVVIKLYDSKNEEYGLEFTYKYYQLEATKIDQ